MNNENKHASVEDVPDCVFFPWETHIQINNEVRLDVPDEMPSPYQALMRLARVEREEDIGRNGPAYAATTVERGYKTPDHLKLFETLFGRDSLRVAADVLPYYPELTRATIRSLAELQGVKEDRNREEEFGRIPHEVRSPEDPIAQRLTRELGWEWPYYGEVDATPDFIRTFSAYVKQIENPRAFCEETYVDIAGNECRLQDSFKRAVQWVEMKLDSNEEGLLEFCSVLPGGIKNQAWKDSWDAYHHSDGTLANHDKGIASIEVQVSAYEALMDAADMYEELFDRRDRARELRDQAVRLKTKILHWFWTEEKGGYFVLGTDRDNEGNLRQLNIRTSNMGHILNSRILEGDDPEIARKREAVVVQLFSPELLCAGGIRTLASDEALFRPGAYQCGSSWPWDTHYIAKGLRRLGYEDKAGDLDARLLRVVRVTHMLPENVRGDIDDVIRMNTRSITVWDTRNNCANKVEQPPQEIQAWTVAAIIDIMEAARRKYSRQRHEFAEAAELAAA